MSGKDPFYECPRCGDYLQNEPELIVKHMNDRHRSKREQGQDDQSTGTKISAGGNMNISAGGHITTGYVGGNMTGDMKDNVGRTEGIFAGREATVTSNAPPKAQPGTKSEDEIPKEQDIVLTEEWNGSDAVDVNPCTQDIKDKITKEKDIYPMTNTPRGKMIIFNVYKVKGHSNREGTHIDAKALDQLFTKLHFNAEVWQDDDAYGKRAEDGEEATYTLTAQEIEDRTKFFFDPMNHRGANAAVMAVLSHGGIYLGKVIISERDGRKISNLPTDYKNGEETDVKLSGDYRLGDRSRTVKLEGDFKVRADEQHTYLVAQYEINKFKVRDFIKDANGEKVYHSGEFVLGVDGKKVFLKTLFESMNKCKTLVGKPKIVIIQACRGGETEVGMAVATDQPSYKPKEDDMLLKESDSILLYATQPGMVSYRVHGYGSWFIQAIVKVFAEYAATMDISSLKDKVNKAVARYVTGKGTKQMPVVNSNLRHKLFFFPGV